MGNVLRRIYHKMAITARLFQYNMKYEGSLIDKMISTLLGYELQAYHLYQKIYAKEYRKCFSDRDRLLTRRLNPKYNILMDDKQVNFQYFQEVKMPKTYFVIKNGQNIQTQEIISDKMILDNLEKHKHLIIKPISGAGGIGVYYLKLENGDIIINFERNKLPNLLKELRKGHWIVTEFVQQAEYSKNIFPWSTNTLRVITLNREEKGELDIVYAVHRFGATEDNPTDNWSRGGLSAKIDIESGVITDSIYDNFGNIQSSHPVTGEQIVGVALPHWDQIREHVLSVHENHSYIPMIAWDIVITDDSFSVIEMNASSGVQIIQVHEPVYKIKGLNEYYR